MSGFIGEFLGTALLIIMGDAVVANVLLQKTKGHNSGWIVITAGWALAVFMGVFVSEKFGGSGHLNPAITLAMTLFKDFDFTQACWYFLAQFSGAFTGAIVVWLAYKPHFDATEDKDAKLAVFSTAPAIAKHGYNVLTEAIATAVLTFTALSFSPAAVELGTLDALPVALVIFAIGLSLGGPTGYAMNPARDFAPRLAHFILPIANKRNSDWGYSWVPVAGPIIGAIAAAWLYSLIG